MGASPTPCPRSAGATPHHVLGTTGCCARDDWIGGTIVLVWCSGSDLAHTRDCRRLPCRSTAEGPGCRSAAPQVADPAQERRHFAAFLVRCAFPYRDLLA